MSGSWIPFCLLLSGMKTCLKFCANQTWQWEQKSLKWECLKEKWSEVNCQHEKALIQKQLKGSVFAKLSGLIHYWWDYGSVNRSQAHFSLTGPQDAAPILWRCEDIAECWNITPFCVLVWWITTEWLQAECRRITTPLCHIIKNWSIQGCKSPSQDRHPTC